MIRCALTLLLLAGCRAGPERWCSEVVHAGASLRACWPSEAPVTANTLVVEVANGSDRTLAGPIRVNGEPWGEALRVPPATREGPLRIPGAALEGPAMAIELDGLHLPVIPPDTPQPLR